MTNPAISLNQLRSAEFPLDKKLYAFDLDDTLLNTRKSYLEAIRQGLADVSGRIEIEDFDQSKDTNFLLKICREFGSGFPELYFKAYAKLRLSNPSKIDEAFSIFSETYNAFYWKSLKPYPGAVNLLTALKAKKKNLCLISNASNPQNQINKIKRTGLGEFFVEKEIFISGFYGKKAEKPSPFMFEKALELTGEKNEDSLFSGNIFADVLASNLAGFFTVFFNYKGEEKYRIPVLSKVDLYLESWEDLIF